MKRITAYIWKYGTFASITIAGLLSIITLIPFCFGIATHAYDKADGVNIAGSKDDNVKCSDVFNNPNAIHLKYTGLDYGFQCGWSLWNSISTFLFEILSVVEVGLYWGFVLVWRKKKLVTFIVYCCFFLPVIMQFYLLYHHCSQIDNGRRSCKALKSKSGAQCSIMPFVITPIFDCVTFLFYVAGTVCGTVLYFCRSKVNDSIGSSGEYVRQPETEKKAKKPTTAPVPQKEPEPAPQPKEDSSFIDFSKLGNDNY